MGSLTVDNDGYAIGPKVDYARAEQLAMRLFDPDILASDEARATSRSMYLTPERTLMFAVFEDGVRAALGFPKANMNQYHNAETLNRKIVQEAYEWVMRDEQKGPFGFITLCDALGLHAETWRRRIKQAREDILEGKLLKTCSKVKASRHQISIVAPRCKEGHRLLGRNVRILPDGARSCATCHRLELREWRRKNHGLEDPMLKLERLRLQAQRMRAAKARKLLGGEA